VVAKVFSEMIKLVKKYYNSVKIIVIGEVLVRGLDTN